MDGHARSIIKTFSWRLIAFTGDSLIVYAFTRQASLSLLVGGVTGIVKLFTFYGHERLWERVRWGRRQDGLAQTLLASSSETIKE